MFFKPWFMGIPKGLSLLPTTQPSTCMLSDICLLLGMNYTGRKARIPSRGTCSPSWLHHSISIGRWSPEDQEHCKEPTSILLLPQCPFLSIISIFSQLFFCFPCFWRKYWATNHWLRYTQGFSKSGLITVNSLLRERWEMDPEMGRVQPLLGPADSSGVQYV